MKMGGRFVFQKLVRSQSLSQSTARRRIIIPLINKPVLNHPLPPFPAATKPLSPFLTSESQIQIPQTKDWSFNHAHSSHHYFPSFSFGFFLNPNSSPGLIKTDVDGCVSEDSPPPTIWADSVKKKRKRKMNKHKLRKLRKRLRRKTR